MNEQEKRRAIVDRCRELNASGLNQGTSGNISVRHDPGMLISPSGVPYAELRPADIVFTRADGSFDGELNPSSEWRFHSAILQRRSDIDAVVHCHAPYATALAIRHMEIPPLHYMVAAAGGSNIPCAEYATFGTEALSQAVVDALQTRRACLMANHGMVACGATLAKAVWLAGEVENLARQYVLTLSLGGPELLSDAEIQRVIDKFERYGAPPGRGQTT